MICEQKWRKIPTEELKIADYSILFCFSIVMVGYSGTFLFTFFLFLSFGSVTRTRHSSGIQVSVNCNVVSFDHLGVKTTFELGAAFGAKVLCH